MARRLVLLMVWGLGAGASGAPPGEIVLDREGLTITASVRIRPGSYLLRDSDGTAALRIVGDDLTVDFQGAELVGCDPHQPPDAYSGIGIVVQGRDITLRGANVRGYKVGVHEFRIEHFEIDGYAWLQFVIEPQGARNPIAPRPPTEPRPAPASAAEP